MEMWFSPCFALVFCVLYFTLRLLTLSWTQIKVQPFLRSLVWVLSKEGCGSAGCPPMEARTPASSTSPLKVRVCVDPFWVKFKKKNQQRGKDTSQYNNKDLNFKIFCCVWPEPPVPTTAPKLLEKRSKQLLVMPVDSHRGDGPIVSTRLLYKPVENGDSWSSIIGKQTEICRSEMSFSQPSTLLEDYFWLSFNSTAAAL